MDWTYSNKKLQLPEPAWGQIFQDIPGVVINIKKLLIHHQQWLPSTTLLDLLQTTAHFSNLYQPPSKKIVLPNQLITQCTLKHQIRCTDEQLLHIICIHTHTHAILRPFFKVHPGKPVLSQRRDLLEQSLDFYEPDVLPATQPIVSKHYRKTQWFGLLLFYRHGISTQCPSNICIQLSYIYFKLSDDLILSPITTK